MYLALRKCKNDCKISKITLVQIFVLLKPEVARFFIGLRLKSLLKTLESENYHYNSENIDFLCYHYYHYSSKNYLYAIQLKGTQGAKAWPVLLLVKLELKGSVQFFIIILFKLKN